VGTFSLPSIRRVYYFGYRAEREAEAVWAITGHKPRVLGRALLPDYQLRIQSLHEVRGRPRHILHNAWGGSFKSYTIVARPGSHVVGTLYRLSLRDRHRIDDRELIDLGWYSKVFIEVSLLSSGKIYEAETQSLGHGQAAGRVIDGVSYVPWLQPKARFIDAALRLR